MANADGGLAIQANGQAIGYEAPAGYESQADTPGIGARQRGRDRVSTGHMSTGAESR